MKTLLLPLLFVASLCQADTIPGWQNGMYEFDKAMKAAKGSEEPLVLLFHVEWCGWCKKLKAQALDDSQLQADLKAIKKIAINPEKSIEAKQLFSDTYQLTGFPTVLVHIPDFGPHWKEVSPFKNDKASPKIFVERVFKAVTDQYNQRGLEKMKAKDFPKAIFYFEKSLKYDKKNIYALVNLGNSKVNAAVMKKDSQLLRQSKSYFEDALKIDPDNKDAKQGLGHIDEVLSQVK